MSRSRILYVFRHSLGAPIPRLHGLAQLRTMAALGREFAVISIEPRARTSVEEAQPDWFLRENVPRAPDVKPAGYEVTSFLLSNSWLGEAQMRKRRFWFGWRQEYGPAPNLRRWIPGAALELPDCVLGVGSGSDYQRNKSPMARERVALSKTQAVTMDSRRVALRFGGSGKVKSGTSGDRDGRGVVQP